MKIKPANTVVSEADMTPMIDMTFQLIAFLMVLVNFTAEDVNARVVLPESDLARPPEVVDTENKILIQLDAKGTIVYGSDDVSVDGLKTKLSNERYILQTKNVPTSEATVIVRAHRDCPTGKVQEVIKTCQENKFDRFILRAKEKDNP
jgi:biopolymer transport protein ExbD